MLILLAPESTAIYRIIYPKTVINFVYYPAHIINKKLFYPILLLKTLLNSNIFIIGLFSLDDRPFRTCLIVRFSYICLRINPVV